MSATNRGTTRQPNDNYPTPEWLTRAIIPVIEERFLFTEGLPLTILEPAAGEGAMLRVLLEAFPNATVIGGDIAGGFDFLKVEPTPSYDLVITNPPFSLAQEFVERARLWLRREYVGPAPMIAMLLRVSFLGSQKRAAWLRANTPSIYVSPRRPSFGTNRNGKRGTDSCEYAWFIFQDGVAPTVGILPTEET